MAADARVRAGVLADLEPITALCVELWPDGSADDHREHARLILTGRPPSTLPLVMFVAERDGAVVGFIEVGLRSHADGCDTLQPVGFIEGWGVTEAHRRAAIGRALMGAAEDWSRRQGAIEVASDTWADRDSSQRAHEALGFEVVDTCVHYRKSL